MNLRARLLFLLFTNNTENEHFICSFNQSTTLSVLTTCLSAQAFIINSPLRFSTRHICTSVLCNIFKHLHCCHVALHWFSLVWGFWFWFFCWVFFFWQVSDYLLISVNPNTIQHDFVHLEGKYFPVKWKIVRMASGRPSF